MVACTLIFNNTFWFGGGGCLGFYFLVVLGVVFFFFFGMVPSLPPLSNWNTPCPYCFSLYTLGGVSRHVKNAHPPANLISQVCHVVSSLWVFSLHVFLLGFILVVYWGRLQIQSSSILGLFECHFVCHRLFHRIL